MLHVLGDLAGARAQFERALRIDAATYGPNHPEVAIHVSNLGEVLKDLGNLVGAKAHHERPLRIFEAAYGPNHPTASRVAANLARLQAYR